MIERILDLLAKSGVSDYAIEKTLGFTQGTISNWRRNKNKVSTI
jgi:transcriptional regulator with XRE-family HTH domain